MMFSDGPQCACQTPEFPQQLFVTLISLSIGYCGLFGAPMASIDDLGEPFSQNTYDASSQYYALYTHARPGCDFFGASQTVPPGAADVATPPEYRLDKRFARRINLRSGSGFRLPCDSIQ